MSLVALQQVPVEGILICSTSKVGPSLVWVGDGDLWVRMRACLACRSLCPHRQLSIFTSNMIDGNA